MASGSNSSNRWKLQDLRDLEQYGLAAELEETRLGREGGEVMGVEYDHEETYDMRDVLSELLTNNSSLFPESSLPLPIIDLESNSHLHTGRGTTKQSISAFLNTPTAHCVKNTQDHITFLNKGHSYELHVKYNGGDHATETMFNSVLLLCFSELRLKNCEEEQFQQWINDHPLERLIEMDQVGCNGVNNIENVEQALHMVSFTWSSLRQVIVSFKVNCLSTEFAARKHGGERGVPLCLQLDTYSLNRVDQSPPGKGEVFERLACNVKVFKDKGADRKQKQEQLKIEKLPPQEQAIYHRSQNVTPLCHGLTPLLMSESPLQQSTPTTTQRIESHNMEDLYQSTTQTLSMSPAVQSSEVEKCVAVESANAWLRENRFGQYVNLFVDYCHEDLHRLSRRDLIELCGPPDGIRMFNALRETTVRVIYISLGADKAYYAICLESLTAQELGSRVSAKLNVPFKSVNSLVRLTSSGILVLIEDIVVQNLRDEECFLAQAVKQEDGQYQVILRDTNPSEHPFNFSQTKI